jgi:hypothetical protein
MRRRNKADRAGLHAWRAAGAVSRVRGRSGPLSSRAASQRVVAAARPTSHPAARRRARWPKQDPHAVSSRHRPGAAATGPPLHDCGAAPVAARAPERDPPRGACVGSRSGSRRDAGRWDGMAGGTDDALHGAARPAAAPTSSGVGQSGRPQDARPGAEAVRAWRDAPLHAWGGSWLNRAGSIERVLKRRALDGQHPHSPAEIRTWFEPTARNWNEQPTPFVWNGKRRQRRRRSSGEQIHRLGGSGACTHKPLKHSRSVTAEECTAEECQTS